MFHGFVPLLYIAEEWTVKEREYLTIIVCLPLSFFNLSPLLLYTGMKGKVAMKGGNHDFY